MYRQLLIILLAVIYSVAALSCKNNQKPEQRAAPSTLIVSTQQPGGGIKISLDSLASSKDLVCGMSLKNGIGDTTSFNGKLYGFCSEGCKKNFLSNPTKYIK